MKMRKSMRCSLYLFSTLALMLTFLLAGCGSNASSNGVDKSYVLVKELEFINQSLSKSQSGDVYLYRAQIKNNSSKTIKGITIDVKLNNGEYTTLSTYDTLLPGEVSSYVECYGPTSGNVKEMEATKITIRMYDENNKEMIIKYDVGQDLYQYEEGKALSTDSPLVLANQLEVVDPQLIMQDNEGVVYFQAAIKNNSDYKLTNIVYTFELETGLNSYLMTQEQLEPGQKSSLLKTTGPESKNLLDLKIKNIKYSVINKEGKSIEINYDSKLEKYLFEK